MNLRPPDALIVASGLTAQANLLVTNDDEWRRKAKQMAGRVRVVYLGDYVSHH